MATNDQRGHILSIMQFFLANAKHVGYNAARPMKTFDPLLYEQDVVTMFGANHSSEGKMIFPDCSEMVTLICRWAGLKDPSGPTFNYDGYGNSATMYDYLGHYTNAWGAQTGAIVVFGEGGADHAAMVMVPDPDKATANPVLFSHGSSAGPIAVKFNDYLAAEPQQKPATFLNVAPL